MSLLNVLASVTLADANPNPPQNSFVFQSTKEDSQKFVVAADAVLQLSGYLNTLCQPEEIVVPILSGRSQRAVRSSNANPLSPSRRGKSTSPSLLDDEITEGTSSTTITTPSFVVRTPMTEDESLERRRSDTSNNNSKNEVRVPISVQLATLSDEVDENGNMTFPLNFGAETIQFVAAFMMYYRCEQLPLQLPEPFVCHAAITVTDTDAGPFHQFASAKLLGPAVLPVEQEMMNALLFGGVAQLASAVEPKEPLMSLSFAVDVLHCATFLDVEPLQKFAALAIALSLKHRSPKAIEEIFRQTSRR